MGILSGGTRADDIRGQMRDDEVLFAILDNVSSPERTRTIYNLLQTHFFVDEMLYGHVTGTCNDMNETRQQRTTDKS